MKFFSFLCIVLLLAYSGQCDSGKNDCFRSGEAWSFSSVGRKLGGLMKCHLGKAVDKVSSIADFTKGLMKKSTKYLEAFAAAGMLLKLKKKDTDSSITDDSNLFLDMIPADLNKTVSKYVDFFRKTLELSSTLIRTKYNESKLPSLGLDDILNCLHKAGKKHEIDVVHLGHDISEAARTLKTFNVTTPNITEILNGIIKSLPGSAITVLKQSFGLEIDREPKHMKTNMEKYIRRAVDFLKLMACKLLEMYNLEGACHTVAQVLDYSLENFAPFDVGRQGRSLGDNLPVQEYLLQNFESFPLHLFLDARLKQSSSPIEFVALTLQVNPVYKALPQGRSLEKSAVPAVASIKVDLVNLAEYGGAFLESVHRGISTLVNETINVLSDGVDFNKKNPVTPYNYHHETSWTGRTLSSFNGFDISDAMFQCLYSEILSNKPRLSRILKKKMETVSPESSLSVEDILSKYFNNLQQNGTRDKFVTGLIPHLLKYVESEEDYLSTADLVIFYFSCLEDKNGPLEAIPVSDFLHVGDVRDVILETFDILDHELSDMLRISRSLVPEYRKDYVNETLGESIEILLNVWKSFQNTRSNSLCFVRRLCDLLPSEVEYHWHQMAVRIYGIAFEILRCYEDGTWNSLPYMNDVLLRGEPACQHLPYQDCGKNQLMENLITSVFDYVQEN